MGKVKKTIVRESQELQGRYHVIDVYQDKKEKIIATVGEGLIKAFIESSEKE